MLAVVKDDLSSSHVIMDGKFSDKNSPTKQPNALNADSNWT